MPWQNTMLGLVPFILSSLLSDCCEVNAFVSRPLIPEGMCAAITLPTTVLPVVRRNWRRFGRGDSGERSGCSIVVHLTWKPESDALLSPRKGYHFPCKQFSSTTIPAESAVTVMKRQNRGPQPSDIVFRPNVRPIDSYRIFAMAGGPRLPG